MTKCEQTLLKALEDMPRSQLSEMFEAVNKVTTLLALEATGGNQVHAAKLLKINRNTLRKRMEK